MDNETLKQQYAIKKIFNSRKLYAGNFFPKKVLKF